MRYYTCPTGENLGPEGAVTIGTDPRKAELKDFVGLSTLGDGLLVWDL